MLSLDAPRLAAGVTSPWRMPPVIMAASPAIFPSWEKEASLGNPSAHVSTFARGAIGWRNPSGNIVDVIRTATVTLMPYSPDPTTDQTPTNSAVAGNKPFPPIGCNTFGGICHRTPSAVTVSKVKRAQWEIDGGSYTSTGVTPNDGVFDEETGEGHQFIPTSQPAS
jgi:hypothetical protein